jgi:amino acid transporter
MERETDGATALKRNALGTRDLVVMIIATAVPLSSVAGLMPIAIGYGTGVGTPGAWLAASLILVVFAIGWTRMSHYVTNAGAFYAYISRGLGRPWGLSGSVLALVAYNAMVIGSLALLGAFAHASFDSVLGIDLPWEAWSAIGLVLVGLVAYRSVDLGARLLLFVVCLEFVLLAIVSVKILFDQGLSAYPADSFAPNHVFIAGIGVTFAMSVMSSLGFEAAAVYGEEAREPRKSVPRATIGAIAFIGIVYILVCWSLIAGAGGAAAQGVAAQDPGAFVFALTQQYVGTWASDFMQIWVVFGILGTCIACTNLATRYFYVLGRDRVLPSTLSRTRGRYGAPWHATLVVLVLSFVVLVVCALAKVDPYVQLGTGLFALAVLAIAALMAIASVAVFRFFRTEERGSVLATAVMPVLAFAGLTYIVVAVLNNYGTLSGATTGLLPLLPWLLLIGGVGAFLYALWLRQARPDRYALLGEVEDPRVAEAPVSPDPAPAAVV